MTGTLIALALLSSPLAMHDTTTDVPTTEAPSTTTSGTDDGWIDRDKFEACEVVGYRYYSHRVHTGDMAADIWDGLAGDWPLVFAGPHSPMLVSPLCD